MAGFNYRVKTELSEEILHSITGSQEMKNEINAVFKRANTRINALKDQGLTEISSSYQSLGTIADGGTYGSRTYFSTTGYSASAPDEERWKQIVNEYSQAVAFLNQEDSTVSGAQHKRDLLRQALDNSLSPTGSGLDESIIEELIEAGLENDYYTAYNAAMAGYVDTLKDLVGEWKVETREQMEQDAKTIQNDITSAVNRAVDELTNNVEETIESWIDF